MKFLSFVFLISLISLLCENVVSQGLLRTGPKTCFVIRSYWKNGFTYGDGALFRLLKSLQAQTMSNWEAHIVVVDNKPFPDLYHLLDSVDDDRIQVFANWVRHRYKPREEGGTWEKNYHSHLYNATDAAIQKGCSPDAEWLVVTNGDNLYGETFLQVLSELDPDIDAVAFDYYSRYQNISGGACDRFRHYPEISATAFSVPPAPPSGSAQSLSPFSPRCKQNFFSMCHTDGGADALKLARFRREGRAFGDVKDPSGFGLHDGFLAIALKQSNWKVLRLRDACLVNHGPSPQQCASRGQIWDDTDPDGVASTGGTCLSIREASEKLGVAETVLRSAVDEGILQGRKSSAAAAAASTSHSPRRKSVGSKGKALKAAAASIASDEAKAKRAALERFSSADPKPESEYEIVRIPMAPYHSAAAGVRRPFWASMDTGDFGESVYRPSQGPPRDDGSSVRGAGAEGDDVANDDGADATPASPPTGKQEASGVPVLTCLRKKNLVRASVFTGLLCRDNSPHNQIPTVQL